MTAETPLVACYGCGALVPDVNGPVHRYIGASPGCWAIHGEVLARRYADDRLSDPLLLLGNSYPVQHPGTPSPQAIRSVAIHLMGLYLSLEGKLAGRNMADVLRAAAAGRDRFVWLTPPEVRYPTTILDVRDAGPAEFAAVLQRMAAETWATWADHQPQIRRWSAELGLG